MSGAIAETSHQWQLVSLEKVIRHRKRFIQIDDLEFYKRCRVQVDTKGIILRDIVRGTEIRTKAQQVCRSEELLVAEIDAKMGGYGIVPESLDGAVVSSHYFLYEVDRTQLDLKFLDFFIRTPGFRDQVAAQGSTNYAAIRPHHVLEYQIPLPPLDEQRRVVARIEELVAKVEEARGLRSEAVREAELLLKCANSHILDSDEWQVSRLETVLTEPPRNGLSPQRVVESDGRQMLRINAVSSSLTRYVDLSAHKLVDVSDDVARPFTLQNDDVFIVRYNGDINRLAKAAIFKATESSNVVYPDKLMRLRADLTKILPDFLVYALSSRRVRTQIEELGITTAGQIGISGKNAKSFLISVPPISEQRRIVSYLDDLQARVDKLKRLQSGTEAEFNALLSSILDKAFKGEL